MGKASRQRRENRQHQQSWHSSGRSTGQAPGRSTGQVPGQASGDAPAGVDGPQPTHDEVLDAILEAGYQTWSAGDGAAFEQVVQVLIGRPDIGGWRRFAERALQARLRAAVTAAWQRGWQPADVVRYTGRRLGGSRSRLVQDAVADELQQYAQATVDPLWLGQLETIGAQVWWPPGQSYLGATITQLSGSDWTTVLPEALELFCLLTSLRTLEQLGPVPGQYHGPAPRPGGSDGASGGDGVSGGAGVSGGEQDSPAVDAKILARIRALLAKAEATTSEAEAEAFTAGAQERMARYSIDAAMLAATAPGGTQQPSGRRIGIDNPYESSKAILLDRVAKANRCQSIWVKELGYCTVLGFPADLTAVEALFTSLLVQAVTAMNRAGQRSGPGGRSRTKSFRQSFLVAYAARIGERLAEITAAQTQAASAEPGGGNVLPVLASRSVAVDEKVTELFPALRSHSGGAVTDAEGWYSGRASADLATLQTGAPVSG